MLNAECIRNERLFDSWRCPGACPHLTRRSQYHHCELMLEQIGSNVPGGLTQEETAEVLGWSVRAVAAEEQSGLRRLKLLGREACGGGEEEAVAVASAPTPTGIEQEPRGLRDMLIDIGDPVAHMARVQRVRGRCHGGRRSYAALEQPSLPGVAA